GGHPGRTAALFAQARRALRATAQHREALWQDRAFLSGVAARSGGDLGPDDVQAVLDHAWLQASQRTEEELWYVDPERLATLDGQAIDDGTPREVAGTVDPEDLPVLLAIRLLELGPPRPRGGRMPTWDHLLVDEHQERAAIELFALGGVLAPGADLTLSGDRAQRVDRSGQTAAQGDLGALLGRAALLPVRLRLSHRATAEIGAFAHAVLGPLAAGPEEPAIHHGPPVAVSRYGGAGEALAALVAALVAPRATGSRPEVAIIARDPNGARRLFAVLDAALPARLVLAGDFTFGRGELQVTWVGQVGGMEFDTVVVPDADAWTYPEDDDARRHLYVALTRARRQLWVQSPGEVSSLLPAEV
ncbi:MAG: ATP-binding domain-containing protein, partial [Pseudomonadota bacterium]